MDQWLSACIALERAKTAIQDIRYNQNKSKQLAEYLIVVLVCLTIGTNIHDHIHQHVLFVIRLLFVTTVHSYRCFIFWVVLLPISFLPSLSSSRLLDNEHLVEFIKHIDKSYSINFDSIRICSLLQLF